MKQILAVAVLFASLAVHAEVVKPATTSTPANGSAVIDGAEFDYSVDDRGWMTFASFNAEGTHATASKTFRLDYKSKPQSLSLSDGIAASIEKDAKAKCQELGELEFPGQVSTYPDSMSKTLSTTFLNSKAEKLNGKFAWGFFLCEITIDVKGK